MKVRSGAQTRFWHDIWVGNCALKLQFPKLFSYSSNKDVSVQETHADGVWSLQFRRSLSDEEMGDWSSLLDLLSTVQLVEGADVMRWEFESKKQYTTQSLYRFLTFRGVKVPTLIDIWNCRVPLKIQIFLWMVFHDRIFHDRIQSAVQLKKRRWAGEVNCKMCGERETADHILFGCPTAMFLWIFLKDSLKLSCVPTSRDELFFNLLTNNSRWGKSNMFFLCAGALTTLWKTRNELVFDDKVIPAPVIVIHKLVACLSNWKRLLSEGDLLKVEGMMREIQQSCALDA